MEAACTYVIVPVVSGLCDVLIDRLLTLDARNLMGRYSTAAELSKLRTSLLIVDRVADDAERKQDSDPAVRSWLKNVKHAVYDAEDLLYDIFTDALHKKGLLSVSRITTGILALNPFHEDIDSKLQQLNRRFEGFAQMINDLHLETSVGQHRSLLSCRETSSFVDESCICGRNDDRDQIIKILEDDVPEESYVQGSREKHKDSLPNISIRIVAIVGMAGIGKTTLAQLIFNHPKVAVLFKFKAWACVSEQEFDVNKTIKSILDTSRSDDPAASYYTYGNTSTTYVDTYLRSLQRQVAGKRILLVLDDVWDENFKVKFDALLTPLKSAALGSTIIITTRNAEIAREVHAIPILLNELPDADCWNLFKIRAFGDPHASVDDQSLETNITKMVANCKGLPLAIKALGNLVRYAGETDYKELESIANGNVWNLLLSELGILQELLLSYYYLPPYLRRCFAYCSIFPKNYLFDKDRLVMLWMAEGFIVPEEHENRSIEDIGNSYFHSLLARCFFQVSGTNSHYFVMHDLIHDLAVQVMGEFGFMLESNLSTDNMMETPRHFSYLQSKYDTSERFRLTDEWSNRLRTFLPLGTIFTGQAYLSNDLLQRLMVLSRLRVLTLCGYRITNIPPSIGSLKHLCYLDFSSTLIEKLPDSICELSNLQTLLLCHCQYLMKLPTMMRNLIFLRHLDIRGTRIYEMPDDVGSLSHLQTLTGFVIGKRPGNSIRELEKLSALRGTLRITGIGNVDNNADALAANLKDKSYLEELVLEWSATSDDPEKASTVLTALKPHETLTKLTIDDYPGTSFPQWVADSAFCCLRTLQLSNCSNCICLPSLGELPSLVHLSIKNFHRLEIVGPQFYGDLSFQFTPFRTLKILHFEDLPQWHTWYVHARWAFHKLQELSLIRCSRLVGKLPAELLSLRKLEILDCQQLKILIPQLPQLTTLKFQYCELVDLATLTNLSSLTSLDLSFESENNTFVRNLENLTSLSYLRIAGLHKLSTFNQLKFPSTLDTLVISQPVDILTRPLSGFYDSVELLPSLHVLRCMPPSLTSLSIGGFKDLDLPQHSYMSLQHLSIVDCYLSEPLHFPLGDFLMLEYLEIKRCFHLESFDITSASRHGICLNELLIDNCPSLLSFTRVGLTAPNLRTLSITNCKNLLCLPEDMDTCMTSLLSLSLKDCPDLDSFPKGGLPSSLQTLRITYCKRLTSNWKQWKLQQLVSLARLEIQGCEEVECFPPQGWLPASLTTLVIAHFPSLVFLIGEALQQLNSLQELAIIYCQELLSLPEEGMPPSLKYLGIYFCPLLEERCQRDKGEDWPKISHLPRVTIDFQEI